MTSDHDLLKWSNSEEIPDIYKDTILKVISVHRLVYSIIAGWNFIVFILYALYIAAVYRSYFFLISCVVFLLIGIFMNVTDNVLKRKILNGDFKWHIATVTGRWLGGKYVRSRIITDTGMYTSQQVVFSFKNGMNVVVVEFDGGNSVSERLTLMWNPKVYRLQNQ